MVRVGLILVVCTKKPITVLHDARIRVGTPDVQSRSDGAGRIRGGTRRVNGRLFEDHVSVNAVT